MNRSTVFSIIKVEIFTVTFIVKFINLDLEITLLEVISAKAEI